VNVIDHLVAADFWYSLDPAEPYFPRSLESQGFIHCTQGLETLLAVANDFHQDEPGDFLLLAVDEDRISAPVRWESGYPHIYGPLNRDAIVRVYSMIRQHDGSFELPSNAGARPRR
jgi:uncharacterized protein (DUF952 family)